MEKWRKNGISGDKIIRYRSKLYELYTTVEAPSYRSMVSLKRHAQKKFGEKAKILKRSNTYMYAVYLLYSGSKCPIKR